MNTIVDETQERLTKLYRLEATLPSSPPRAVEQLSLPFMFRQGKKGGNNLFILRLHSSVTSYDYPFRLKIKYKVPSAEKATPPAKKQDP